jgi:uncharacterized protein YjbI with pentapeptide repeats
MANPEHLKLLLEGVDAWNNWRVGNRTILPDLREADLRGATLVKANLSGAVLRSASLRDANLCDANLRDANLNGANLSRADLSRAELLGANLSLANLSRANLSDTILGYSLLCFTSLATVKGLPTCRHEGPSSLDYATLMASGPLPDVFLRGCGMADDFIHYLPSFWSQPIQFYSCFISYSHANKSFARRLHDALQGQGIRCWLDEKQLLPGDDIYEQVDQGIRFWDKVLLCCSKASLKSWWVDNEIKTALNKEQQLHKERGKRVLALIPLNLDGYLLSGKWQSGMSTQILTRLAADFRGWEKDNGKFEMQFERVVKALRADAGAREQPPKALL